MLRTALCLVPAFVLALLAGPIGFLLANLGKPDPNDLYMIFDLSPRETEAADIAASHARGVGPERGLLANMITAPPSAFQELIAAGYLLLPVGRLADLCGYAPPDAHLSTGNL